MTKDNTLWFHQGSFEHWAGEFLLPDPANPFYMADGFYHGIKDGYLDAFLFTLSPNLKIFDSHNSSDWLSMGYPAEMAKLLDVCGNLYGIFGLDDWWFDDEPSASDLKYCMDGFPIMFPEFRRYVVSVVDGNLDEKKEFNSLSDYLKSDLKNEFLKKGISLSEICRSFSFLVKKLEANRKLMSKFYRIKRGDYPSFNEYVVLNDILKFGFGACLGSEGLKELIILTPDAFEKVSSRKFKYEILKEMNSNILNINSGRYSKLSYDEKYQIFLNEYKLKLN